MTKTIIVSGSNRGIGKEICRQLYVKNQQVILTSRDKAKAEEAARKIGKAVIPMALDVSDEESIRSFAGQLQADFERIDVLINNAGIMGNQAMIAFDIDQIEKVMQTNFYGPLRLTKAIYPLLEKSAEPRIINISSGMGSLNSMMGGGYAAYRLSKWALNGFSILFSKEMEESKFKVNAMCPGWVKTDMGGNEAPRSIEQGADTAVWLALEDDIPNGSFFRDRQVIEW